MPEVIEIKLSSFEIEELFGEIQRDNALLKKMYNDIGKEFFKLRQDYEKLYDAVRALMDVTDLDGEGGESRELRKFVWNQEDTDRLYQIQGREP